MPYNPDGFSICSILRTKPNMMFYVIDSEISLNKILLQKYEKKSVSNVLKE